jgi:hypothetical protein
MYLEHLTYLISSLSSLIDAGAETDVAETVEHVHNATLFTWLLEKYKPQHPSLLDAFEGEKAPVWEWAAPEILAKFVEQLDPAPNRIRKTFGIEHNGLCLLISWASELIYRRTWTEKPKEPKKGPESAI